MPDLLTEEFELVAKHCPSCNSLVMGKVEQDSVGEKHYATYCCSDCGWESPILS